MSMFYTSNFPDCMRFGAVTYYDENGDASYIYWTTTEHKVSSETEECDACHQMFGESGRLLVMRHTDRAIWGLIPNLVTPSVTLT